MGLVIAGLVVIVVGVILVLFGIVLAWGEARRDAELGGVIKFGEMLTKLLKALAGQPRSTYMFIFGLILIFMGGVIAGVGGLTA